jgi:putative two-component system response regulator
MAIVDVYDTLVSDRAYRKAFTHEEAVRIIMEDAGWHFDPSIAEVFCEIQDQIAAAGVQLSSQSDRG